MFHHSYDSIDDIEPEFTASLDLLLKDKSPSFDFIKANEKDEENSKYYLFFGSTDNSPKAFLKSKAQETKKTLFNKLSPFKEKKIIKWSGPKTYSDTIFIDPKYKNEFSNYFQKMTKEISKKINLKEHKLISPIPFFKETTTPIEFLNSLFKSKNSYEEYIKSLKTTTQKEITQLFKEHKSLELKQYDSLQDCFSYKEKSKDDYKKLKKSWPYNLLNETKHSVMSLENNDQIIAFTVLIMNDQKHSFFNTHDLLNLVDNKILIHMALMLFYEDIESIYLHSLSKFKFSEYFEKLNFNSYTENEYTVS